MIAIACAGVGLEGNIFKLYERREFNCLRLLVLLRTNVDSVSLVNTLISSDSLVNI